MMLELQSYLPSPFILSSIHNLNETGWKVWVYRLENGKRTFFGFGVATDLKEAAELAVRDSKANKEKYENGTTSEKANTPIEPVSNAKLADFF